MISDSAIATKSFEGAKGGSEHYISLTAPAGLGFDEQIEVMEAGYAGARRDLGLPKETAVFRRLFLSDVLNQADAIRKSNLFAEPKEGPVAVSIVQQPPLPGSKLAMIAYHLDCPASIKKRTLSSKHRCTW
jgi:hypothetical protein